jgi:hypothetical protein
MAERIRNLMQRVAAAKESIQPEDEALRERLPRIGIAAVERELVGEIARSLGKAGDLLAAAIERCRETRARLEDTTLSASERRVLIEQYSEQRAHAEKRLRYLLIQREALGWRRHTEIHQQYVIPPRLSAD